MGLLAPRESLGFSKQPALMGAGGGGGRRELHGGQYSTRCSLYGHQDGITQREAPLCLESGAADGLKA